MLSILALASATQAGAREVRDSLALSITILPSCNTAVDTTTGNLREYCNFRRPYRIDMVDSRSRMATQDTGRTDCVDVTNQPAPPATPAPCGTDRSRTVTVVYY